jgi:hypothetical protein
MGVNVTSSTNKPIKSIMTISDDTLPHMPGQFSFNNYLYTDTQAQINFRDRFQVCTYYCGKNLEQA